MTCTNNFALFSLKILLEKTVPEVYNNKALDSFSLYEPDFYRFKTVMESY